MPHRILIADDEPHIVELVRVCLEDSGVEIMEAGDGEAALAAARQRHPDLILLDVMMPRVDGFEVGRRLKADAATRDIPILMLTAKSQPTDRERGADVGAESYVTKPFSPSKLASEVQKLLARRRGGS